MIKFGLFLAKTLKSKKLLNKNIYFELNYPSKRIMIIDDNFDYNLANNLFSFAKLNYLLFNLNSDDDLNEFILNNFDNHGISHLDFLFFKIKTQDIKKYGSILKPNYILINETNDIINELEVKEVFDRATIIELDKYNFNGIKFSLNALNSDYYISRIDYIKERIIVSKEDYININSTNENYLKEILMLFAFIKTIKLDINIFNKLNHKNFTCENKKIYMDIEENNYNDLIKFITRYSDYKIIVIGWKYNYEDISWLYNIEFERLINKNVQKIFCIGNNAYDIATRLKYGDLSEKNIIVSSNIDAVLKEIRSYNLNLYILADKYYLNIIKGGK